MIIFGSAFSLSSRPGTRQRFDLRQSPIESYPCRGRWWGHARVDVPARAEVQLLRPALRASRCPKKSIMNAAKPCVLFRRDRLLRRACSKIAPPACSLASETTGQRGQPMVGHRAAGGMKIVVPFRNASSKSAKRVMCTSAAADSRSTRD